MDLILYINTLYNLREVLLLRGDHQIFYSDADQVKRRRINKREDNYLMEFSQDMPQQEILTKNTYY